MNRFLKFAFVATLAMLSLSSVIAQSPEQIKRDRINASYLISLGRQPSSGELSHWMGRENYTLEQLVNLHNQYLQSNSGEKRTMVIKAYKDAYGRQPTDSDIRTNMAKSWNYTDWMNNHIKYLRENDNAWDYLLAQVYSKVCGRSASEADKRSWPRSDAKPYWMVAAVVEKWHAENSHKSSKGVRLGNGYMTSINVSSPVASEASRIIGQAAGNVIAPGGANVVAPSGANVVAAGGLN